MSDNNTTISGNLVADPTLRYTNSSQKAVLNGRVAVSTNFLVDGRWKDKTTFVNFVVWGDMAEHCAMSLEKGVRVTLTGRLDIREAVVNGEKQYYTEVTASEVAVSLKYATVDGIVKANQASTQTAGQAPQPAPAAA